MIGSAKIIIGSSFQMTGSSEINTCSSLRITGLGFQTIGTAKINTSSCLQITSLCKKRLV